jgi:predicted NBD/HSP70 family sugar kinase
MILFGVDLGGTKIEGVVVDSDTPDKAFCRLRMPTESDRGYDHVISQIERLVIEMEKASGCRRPARIGFGTPGAMDPASRELKNSNSTCLNGRLLCDDISKVLGVQARLANDANCFALAEALFGAARGRGVVVGLILGTGVGGGIVVGGRVLDGLHGIAGEWGHNPICGEKSPCYCGRKGCVETVIAGPALETFYRQRTGVSIRLSEIAGRAR